MQNNSAIQTANQNWGTAGIVDSKGNPMSNSPAHPGTTAPNYKSTGGGDDGITQRIAIEQNIKALNWAVGIMITAFGAAFIFFLLRIDDRFDRVDEPVRSVQISIATQAEIQKAQAESLKSIDEKLNIMGPDLRPARIPK